jgi:hypothetical protein
VTVDQNTIDSRFKAWEETHGQRRKINYVYSNSLCAVFWSEASVNEPETFVTKTGYSTKSRNFSTCGSKFNFRFNILHISSISLDLYRISESRVVAIFVI